MKKKMLKVEEVAVLVGVSAKTINVWYAWAKKHPDEEMAKLLPVYTQATARGTRLWSYSDIWKLAQFKNQVPKGCKGIFGDVTQQYYRKHSTTYNKEDN